MVCLEPFGCLTKLGAKRAEQVQRFVPRSLFGIFRNERTRSTPMDPKLMFCCVSDHLGAFWTNWLPYETRCKRVQTSAKSLCHEVALEFFTTNAHNPPHWTLNSCFGAFHTFWVHLGPLSCLTKLGAKHSELGQKFGPRSHLGVFRDEHA